MSESTMNCGWDFPEWELEYTQTGVTVKTKPSICEECEFFMACFQNLSANALGMPELTMSVEGMKTFVNLQRLVQSEVMFTEGYTLDQVRALKEAKWKTKH